MPYHQTVKKISNPRKGRKSLAVSKSTRKTINRSNNPTPAFLVTLGAVNPRKEKTKMASRKKAKRTKPNSRKSASKSRNSYTYKSRVQKATPKVVYRYRKANAGKKPNGHRRSNPNLFGAKLLSRNGITMILAALVGVGMARILPNVVFRFMPALAGNPVLRIGVIGATAYATSLAGESVMKGTGDPLLLGGLMETGSQVLNAVGLNSIGSVRLSLNGMGAFVPGQFPQPMNPVTAGSRAIVAANAVEQRKAIPSTFGVSF